MKLHVSGGPRGLYPQVSPNESRIARISATRRLSAKVLCGRIVALHEGHAGSLVVVPQLAARANPPIKPPAWLDAVAGE